MQDKTRVIEGGDWKEYRRLVLSELETLTVKVDDLKTLVVSGYVRREEFAPVKLLVYGMTAILLGSMVMLAIRHIGGLN